MKNNYIATPGRTQAILRKYGLAAKKSLGQNFLTEPQVLEDIVEAAGVDKTFNAIEIGPGIGALTEFLAIHAKQVLAFEIDQRFMHALKVELGQYDNINILNEDILEVDLAEEIPKYFDLSEPLAVVANLPYYITTPIIFNLLESKLPIDTFALMMQKEVAERLTAELGTKAYNSLSIAIQYYCDARIAFDVSRTVFDPQPNVDSAILVLDRLDKPRVEVENEDYFFKLVRSSFRQRRKTLWNNLRAAYGKAEETITSLERALEASNIDPKRRAETITIQEFATLADACLQENIAIIAPVN